MRSQARHACVWLRRVLLALRSALRVCPDIVATHSDSNTVLLWDVRVPQDGIRTTDAAASARRAGKRVASDRPLLVLRGHRQDASYALDTSPVGPCVASAGKDCEVLVWDLRDAPSTAGLAEFLPVPAGRAKRARESASVPHTTAAAQSADAEDNEDGDEDANEDDADGNQRRSRRPVRAAAAPADRLPEFRGAPSLQPRFRLGGERVSVRVKGAAMELGAIDDVGFKLCGAGAGSVLASVGCDQGLWLWDVRCGSREGMGGASGLVGVGRSSSKLDGLCVEWCPNGRAELPGPAVGGSEWLLAVGRERDAGVYLWDCRSLRGAVLQLDAREGDCRDVPDAEDVEAGRDSKALTRRGAADDGEQRLDGDGAYFVDDVEDDDNVLPEGPEPSWDAIAILRAERDDAAGDGQGVDGVSTPPAHRRAAAAPTASSSAASRGSCPASSEVPSTGCVVEQIAIAQHHDKDSPGVTGLAWAPWSGREGERLVLASAGNDGVAVLWDVGEVLAATSPGPRAAAASARADTAGSSVTVEMDLEAAGTVTGQRAAVEGGTADSPVDNGPPATAESTSTKATAPHGIETNGQGVMAAPGMPRGPWGRLKPDPDAEEVPRAGNGVLFVHRGHRSPNLVDLRWCPAPPSVSSTSAQPARPAALSSAAAEPDGDAALDDRRWQDGWLLLSLSDDVANPAINGGGTLQLWRPLGLAVHATPK